MHLQDVPGSGERSYPFFFIFLILVRFQIKALVFTPQNLFRKVMILLIFFQER